MAMRAQVTMPGANTCSPAREPAAVSVAGSEDPAEQLIMVLFPKSSWDAVVALARDLNVEPAEALGAALLLLRAKVDATANEG